MTNPTSFVAKIGRNIQLRQLHINDPGPASHTGLLRPAAQLTVVSRSYMSLTIRIRIAIERYHGAEPPGDQS